MILYLDTSALIKRYVEEPESPLVTEWIDDAELFSTNLLARAETVAGIGRLRRMKAVDEATALHALTSFRRNWPTYMRLPITETTVARADEFAWQYDLRGYDAVHLASAHLWQAKLNEPITLVTFDRRLWQAANILGLSVLPENR